MRHVAPVARRARHAHDLQPARARSSNPAGVKRQLLGVFSEAWLEPLTQVLKELGSEARLDRARLRRSRRDDDHRPDPCGGAGERRDPPLHGHARGGRPAARQARGSARAAIRRTTRAQLRAVLDGARMPYRDVALLNAAASLVVADEASDLRDGLERASPGARQRRREGDARASRHSLEQLRDAMSDVLARIEAYKRQEIAAAKAAVPQAEIERRAPRRARRRAALRRPSSAHLAAGPPGPDRRGQEGKPVEGPDPRRFRSAELWPAPMPRAARPACPC